MTSHDHLPTSHVHQSTENEVMEQWKMTFRLSALHSSLLVKDPNTCAQLVLKELYSAYGHIVSFGGVDTVYLSTCDY